LAASFQSWQLAHSSPGEINMAATVSYAPFDDLIACLRRDGLSKEANLLDRLLHKTAWTAGSELLGELGLAVKRIRLEHADDLTEDCKDHISKSMEMVKRVWPAFPEQSAARDYQKRGPRN
jgi:hypothetical protein